MGPLQSVRTRTHESESMSNGNVTDEHERSEWAKARARHLCCKEEIQLLLAKMERVLIWLNTKWWDEQQARREGVDQHLALGLKSYARCQASMYQQLSRVFVAQWTPILNNVTTDFTGVHPNSTFEEGPLPQLTEWDFEQIGHNAT
jgi:hypothetical protein